MNQGSGRTYEYSGETTEWEDILIKRGITTKEDVLLGKGLNPEDFIKPEVPVVDEPDRDQLQAERLNEMNLDELEDAEYDEFADSKALDEYRQQRMKEMKMAAVRNRFGEVVSIVKDDWVREVTEASQNCIVIIHLFEDSLIECQVMDECLAVLAPKFKYLKFLRIKSTHAIENWPERNLPTLFIYDQGALRTQLVKLNQIGGKSAKAADLEWYLVKQGIITDSELDEDPRECAAASKRSPVTGIRGVRSGGYRTGASGDLSDNDDEDDED